MDTNTSTYSLEKTANTTREVAAQRASSLASLGVNSVVELCVGPSLPVLTQEYARVGIDCTGNDIDPRYAKELPGKWIVGDCFSVDVTGFDAVVFAPPLSKGCSGCRADALGIEDVYPRFDAAVEHFDGVNVLVLVLPGRAKATRKDREELHRLLSLCWEKGYYVHVQDRFSGCRKYTDVVLLRM